MLFDSLEHVLQQLPAALSDDSAALHACLIQSLLLLCCHAHPLKIPDFYCGFSSAALFCCRVLRYTNTPARAGSKRSGCIWSKKERGLDSLTPFVARVDSMFNAYSLVFFFLCPPL